MKVQPSLKQILILLKRMLTRKNFFSNVKFNDEAEKSFIQTKSNRKLDEALSNIHELYEIESTKEFKKLLDSHSNFELTKIDKIINKDEYNILYEKKQLPISMKK